MKSKDETSPWMTRQQVAAFFQVDPMTVYAWGKSDKLTEYKHGRLVRYSRKQVENLLQPIHGDQLAEVEKG